MRHASETRLRIQAARVGERCERDASHADPRTGFAPERARGGGRNLCKAGSRQNRGRPERLHHRLIGAAQSPYVVHLIGRGLQTRGMELP